MFSPYKPKKAESALADFRAAAWGLGLGAYCITSGFIFSKGEARGRAPGVLEFSVLLASKKKENFLRAILARAGPRCPGALLRCPRACLGFSRAAAPLAGLPRAARASLGPALFDSGRVPARGPRPALTLT